jgi:hypothetical protein
MTAAKHTPGPWHRNIPPAKKYAVIFAGKNDHVSLLCIAGKPDEECEANANFIAAAPLLLNALHSAETELERMEAASGKPVDITVILAIRAAIA